MPSHGLLAARWLLIGVATLVVGCSGAPPPAAQPPPQTVPATEPVASIEATEAAPATPAPEAPEPRASLPRQPADVVIEPADPDPDDQLTLAEAARRERQRRSEAGQPMVVITDANLQDHAVGQLTFMEDEPEEETEGEGEGDENEAEGPDEQYWRDRVRNIRQRWADAAAAVPALEERVAELRRRFYETDDPFYRDSRIKPAWDRAIDLIAQTRAEAEAHRSELEAVLEEGRLVGALPGWLREGIELEPETPKKPEEEFHEPGEPQIVEPTEGRSGP